MGTNFYTLKGSHIGKRSAAGSYCYDCGITLCKNGQGRVHYSDSKWFDLCPKCGSKSNLEKLSESAVGRELGFNHKPFKSKGGVKSCSSFSWAKEPRKLNHLKYVKDEYGRVFDKITFDKMLDAECPIQFFDSIGKDFS